MTRIKKERSIIESPLFLLIFMTILVLIATVGYSALSNNLMISGEANIRVPADIRITNIKLLEATNEGYETYNSEYYKDGIKIFTTLPNIDSSVTYEVEVKSTSDLTYVLSEINTLINTNENMIYTIEEINKYEEITSRETKIFKITVKYKDNLLEVSENNLSVFEIEFKFIEKEEKAPIVIVTEENGEITITALDEGSGLSEDNIYKYYLSTSALEPVNGEWKNYTNGESFNIEQVQTLYLWIYPIRDKVGNVSDNKTFNEPYIIKTLNYSKYVDGTVVYYDVLEGRFCNNYHEDNSLTNYNGIEERRTTENQNSCLKFYAFNYDEGDTVLNLLLDHDISLNHDWDYKPLTKTIPSFFSILKNETSSWVGTRIPENYILNQQTPLGAQYTIPYSIEEYKARIITANEIAEITGNTSFNETTSKDSEYFYLDTNDCLNGDIGGCKYGWLYDRTSQSCERYGCLNNSDIMTNGYWTATAVYGTASIGGRNSGWCIVADTGKPRLSGCPGGSYYMGLRPVIELEINSKPNIEFEYKKEDSEIFGKGKITITSLNELSNENKYQYYISTSNTELVGGEWLNYINKEEFEIVKGTGKYYVWIYPISDVNGKINDNFISIEKTYVLSEIVVDSFKNYEFTGNYEEFITPKTGFYQIELWGASGGTSIVDGSTQNIYGKGGYTSGVINLLKDETIYIYMGGQGSNAVQGSNASGGYNGGGLGTWDNSDNEAAGGGGGATDIRYFGNIDLNDSDLLWNSELGLNSRIMVAGAGGGSTWTVSGGNAGGLIGFTNNPSALAGTQTSGYAFGIGQDGSGTGNSNGIGGAGSGYYGGYTSGVSRDKEAGGGGSSYISGYKGSVAITSSTNRTPKSGCTDGTTDITCSYHYSNKTFFDTKMISGNEEMSSIDGNIETGHSGNGYAKITYIGDNPIIEFDTENENNNTVGKISIHSVNELSEENKYEYYLSTSNTELKDGEWLTYTNKESFEINQNPNQTLYIWVYTVKDIEGNVNDNKVYNEPYMLEKVNELYTITYNLNSGTQGSGVVTNYTIETATFNLPTPSRTGYTFNGWYTSSDLTGTAVTQITKGSTGNKTYYAKWTPITYTITYNLNNGTQGSGAVTSYTIETETFNLPTPSRTGYTFGGWYTSSDLTETAVTQITKGTIGNKTYHAKWTINNYTLTANANGGSITSTTGWTGTGVSATKTLNYNEEYSTLPTPTREGYTFNGWYTAASGGSQVLTTTKIGAGNTTIYAQWTINKYYLDLNGYTDGVSGGNITGYGTADIYINGTLTANDVSDFYQQFDYGTIYEIKDIKTSAGHTYNGVYSGSLTGTIPDNHVRVFLNFTTNNYTLTVNPNGGKYNGTTSNSTFMQAYDTVKNVGTPTAPAGYTVTFNANGGSVSQSSATSTRTFSSWSLSGTGKYVAASKATVDGLTRTDKMDGTENYENFAFSVSGLTSDKWYGFRYPSYTYTSGDTYEIRAKVRVNTLSGTAFYFRHAAITNDYATTGRIVKSLDTTMSSWTDVVMTRTISGTTITQNSTSYTVAPLFEGYTGNLNGITASANFDIKNMIILNKTKDTLLQSNANAYLYRAGNGTLTANYTNGSVTCPTPTRSGYTFNGWYTAASGGSKVCSGGGSYTPSSNTTIYAQWTLACTTKPEYTYYKNGTTTTANHQFIDDGNGNWRIKFLESGTFTLTKKLCGNIDAFLVGGGGGGARSSSSYNGGGGGGGGKTLTSNGIIVTTNQPYSITIGAGGGSATNGSSTTAFNLTAAGGTRGSGISGGSGGSGGGAGGYSADYPGGAGGSNGSNGYPSKNSSGTIRNNSYGNGSNTNTYAFSDSSLELYAGGGGGGAGRSMAPAWGTAGKGGNGGGGAGGKSSAGSNGTANTGGGGGGGAEGGYAGGTGGSGIVIIKNSKINKIYDIKYTYTGLQEIVDEGNGNWQIKFKTSGNLTFLSLPNDTKIDVFLVGGGGGGGVSSSEYDGGGGGGSGYTTTSKNISISTNNSYSITIGAGGGSATNGSATTAFDLTAAGGNAGNNITGGKGGSGGGAGGYSADYPGGAGGSNGSNGYPSKNNNGTIRNNTYGSGNGSNTYAFGDSNLEIYAGGGGGGSGRSMAPAWGTGGKGGTGGGGTGGTGDRGGNGTANTGGGGGGGAEGGYAGGSGGSGIVIIRNKR